MTLPPRAAAGQGLRSHRAARSRALGRLAFTLEVYDALSGHSLAKGRKIAVTGTIDLDGNVGEIGGMQQKVLGAVRAHADLVLVPDANAADARPPRTGASGSSPSRGSARR